MPVTRPHGYYVNPFSMLCDCCEDRVPSDWIEERCRYECDKCQFACRTYDDEEEIEIQAAE